MSTDNPPKIRAILTSIEVQITGDLGRWNRSKCSVELSVDGKVVSTSKAKSASSVLKWEWNRDNKISFKPSSIMKIVMYRGSGTPFNLGKASVAQYEGRVENLLDNVDASFDLTDQQGAFLPVKMKIALSRVSASQENPYVAIGGLPATVVHPETNLDHAKEVGSVVYEGFKTTLQGLYDCSDMFLPLKTAAGAILTIIKVVEGMSNNKDELAQLKAKLEAIRLIVEKYQEHGGIGAINLRIKNFCERRRLCTIWTTQH